MQYGYLVGSLLLGCIYFLIFLKLPDTRLKLIQGGIFLAPFALIASFYIPEYWNPPYAFGYIPYLHMGLEDILFCYFTGGIVLGLDSIINGNVESLPSRGLSVRYFIPYIIGIVVILIGELLFPARSILILGFTGPLIALCTPYFTQKLLSNSFRVGLAFSSLYFIFFTIFLFLFPTYISAVYTRTGNLGISLLSVPIEELLFAFSAGFGWTFAYTLAVLRTKKTIKV